MDHTQSTLLAMLDKLNDSNIYVKKFPLIQKYCTDKSVLKVIKLSGQNIVTDLQNTIPLQINICSKGTISLTYRVEARS